MKVYFVRLVVILAVWLSGCGQTPRIAVKPTEVNPSPGSNVAASPTPVPTHTSSVTPTLTHTVLPTATATSTPTAKPTTSPTPTLSPTPSLTPMPSSAEVLSPENASQITSLASWGRGEVLHYDLGAADTVWVVGTPLGVYLYDVQSLDLIRHLDQAASFYGPEARNFFFSPDRELLVLNYSDRTTHIVRVADGSDVLVLEPIVNLPYFAVDYLKTLPEDERVQEEEIFWNEIGKINAVRFSPDLSQVAIAYSDYSEAVIGVWNLGDGRLVHTLKNDTVVGSREMTFAPDGTKLLVLDSNGTLAMWDLTTAKLLWRAPRAGHFNEQPFSLDSSLLATEITHLTSLDAEVSVRSARFGDLLGQAVGRVAAHPFSPDNKLLLTTSYQYVRVWTVPGMVFAGKIDTGLEWPQASFSPDGEYILVNGGEQAYRASDLSLDPAYPAPPTVQNPEPLADQWGQLGHLAGLEGFRRLPDGSLVVWGIESRDRIWWWEALSGEYHPLTLDSPLMEGANLDLSFDGSQIAACTEAGLELVETTTGQVKVYDRCRTTGIVRFSPDGKTLYRSNGILIDILDLDTGELAGQLRGHGRNVARLLISPNGRFLASGSIFTTGGHELILWSLDPVGKAGGWMVPSQSGAELEGLALTQDGSMMLAGLGGTRLWRLADSWQIRILETAGFGLAFSPDERLAAAGESNGGLSLWNTQDWSRPALLAGHQGRLLQVFFTAGGRELISASADGTLRLWGIGGP